MQQYPLLLLSLVAWTALTTLAAHATSSHEVTPFTVRAGEPGDRDGDGIRDRVDLDDDNDGIPDAMEGLVDADADGEPDADSTDSDDEGLADAFDLDSDNDGIYDLFEALNDRESYKSLDGDSDGIIDLRHAVGANGLADVLETSVDSGELKAAVNDVDDDDMPDYRDTDSDDDQIYDVVEAGGKDDDTDGRVDNFYDADGDGVDDRLSQSDLPLYDSDGNGALDFRDTDSDGDTIPDVLESGGNRSRPVDTDDDGTPDYRDLDSDDDGKPDAGEVGADPLKPVDTDGDGVADYRDVDDGVVNGGTGGSGTVTDPDSTVEPATPAEPDTAPGSPSAGAADADADGVPNRDDLDDDNDGLPDALEGDRDSDADGVVDRIDLDSDNDGLLDSVEAVSDFSDEIAVDTDTDGVPDYRDIDSDNDSIWDVNERGYGIPLQLGRLPGTVDANGLAPEAGNLLADTDGDGVVDFRDLESDNDGIPDVLEARGVDRDGDGRLDAITDNDGDGAEDNLLTTTGAWIDTDADILPDHLDLDSDQDGIPDLREAHGDAPDLDNDGVLDAFIDDDHDGYDDNLHQSGVVLRDTDNDGDPDQVDLDSDGDGIFDLVEAGGVDADGDGVVDAMADSDRDGIVDSVDVDQTGGEDVNDNGIDDRFDALLVDAPDTDGDGIVDDADPDANGDGFYGVPGTGQGTPTPFPDDDGDGVANFQQDDGEIKAGLDGNGFGCSVIDGDDRGTDPLPAVLLLLSLFVLTRERFLGRPGVRHCMRHCMRHVKGKSS